MTLIQCTAGCRQCWAIKPFIGTVERDAWAAHHTEETGHETAVCDGWPPRVPALRVMFPPKVPRRSQ